MDLAGMDATAQAELVRNGEASPLELATVDHEIDNATGQIVTQDAENRADREREEQARREERQAQMEESSRRYGEVFRLETTPPSFPTGR